jgi:zona occludens toxin (predicted ATPase)
MITLITAVPGSGKTLRVIGMILDALKTGRPVYARIDGLLIDKVKPAPDDWRDTPEGSLVIYDEAQEVFPSNAKPGPVTDERLTAMEVHRHTGHDLVFITQAPSFIHHHIRKLVGCHIHLYRPNGLKGANVYTWNFAVNDPNDRREQERADHQVWKYPKEHFSLYKSATIHTHKVRIPRKIAAVLLFLVAGICVVAWRLADGFESFKPDSASLQQAAEGAGFAAPAPLPASTFQWARSEPLPALAGCVDSARGCLCYTADLVPLDIPIAQCKAIIKAPLPRSIGSGSSSGPDRQHQPQQHQATAPVTQGRSYVTVVADNAPGRF